MISDDRFWGKVTKTATCWHWTGAANANGYGRVRRDGRLHLAHRYSWFLIHGQLPKRLMLHRCDTPSCVRPDHLFDGSHEDNMLDMAQKGRAASPGRKLTVSTVAEIRRRFAQGERQVDLASAFGTTAANVHCLVRNKSWVSA